MVSDFRNAGAPVTAVDFNNNVTDIRRAVLHESPGILMDSSPMGGTSIAPVRQKRQIWDSGVDKDPAPFTLKWINTNAKEKTYNAKESDREFRKMSANYYPIVHLPKCAVDTTPDDYAICLNPSLDIFSDSAWNNGNWCYLVNEKYDYSNGYSFSISGASAARLVPATDATDVDVYLHVRLSDDADFKKKILGKDYASAMSSSDARLCAYVVTCSQSVPAALGGEETRCVCVGRLFCPTQSQIKDSYVPRVTSQYIRSQFNCATEESEEPIPKPFSLKVYEYEKSGKSYPLVYLPYGAVQVHDGDAVAFAEPCNNAFSDGVWCYVANSVDSYGRFDSPTLDFVPYASDGYADVFLFVFKGKDDAGDYYQYALLFDSTWPRAIPESDRLACVYVGAFARDASGKNDTAYIAAEQVINDAQTVKLGEEEIYPFKFKYITDENGSQKLVVYLPKWSVKRSKTWDNDYLYSSNESYCENNAVSGMDDWYYVDDADSNDSSNLFLFYKVKGFGYVQNVGYSYYETYFRVARAKEGFARNLDSTAYGSYYSRSVLVGREDSSGNVVSFLHGAYYTSDSDYDYEKTVYQPVDASALKEVQDKLDEAKNDLQNEIDTLTEQLENDEDLISENYDFFTKEITGLQDQINSILDFINQEDYDSSMFSNVDWLLKKLGYVDENGDPLKDEDGKTLSVADAIGGTIIDNTDAAIDAALNDTTVGEDGTVTSTAKFASADHSHGNIDKDGKIKGATGRLLVTTGNDGKIEAAASVVPDSLESTFAEDVGYLSAVLGTFDYDSAKSQFTLSTDKLKYNDTGTDKHSGDCLLKVDKGGYVLHDGNTSYNALYDLMTNHFDSNSSANNKKGEIALKYTALALKTNDKLDANATKAVVFKGESLATKAGKAELADMAVLAPKTGESNSSPNYAPKSDAVPKDNETEGNKIARVGTSSYAARADHVHPWPKEALATTVSNHSTMAGSIENNDGPNNTIKDPNVFTLNSNATGFSLYVCSGVTNGNTQMTLYFREVKINKFGLICSIGKESKSINILGASA